MKVSKFLIGTAMVGVLAAGAAHAAQQSATQSVTANISFDTPLSFTSHTDFTFGTVKAAQTGTYVMAPQGTTVTASNSV